MGERELELEALEAIYMNDLEVIERPGEFHIRVFPIPDAENPADNKVGIRMEVKLPADYPNVPPEIMLQSLKNVPGKVCQTLETKIRETAQSSLGDQMIFTFVSIVKEWLDEHNESADTPKQEDTKKQVENLPEEKEGTPVTPETFNLWFKGFKIEMEAKKKVQVSQSSQLTGKEWFARSSSSTALLPASSTKKTEDGAPDIDWELFTAEEGDENLDDIEFDDDNIVEDKEIGVYREPGTEDQGTQDEVVDDDE